MIRNILAIDDSAAADCALLLARTLALREGATLVLCSVVDRPAVYAASAEAAGVNPVPLLESFESQVAKGSAWIGTPEDIRKAIAAYDDQVDGFESASLQVNFGMITKADAERSMKLFAREVMPHFKND